MRIVYLNGIVEEHSWHEMRRLFWHPHFVAMVIFLAGLVFVLRPYDELIGFDILRLTVFYVSGVICFLVLLVSSIYQIQSVGRVVYTWVPVSFSIIGATFFGLLLSLILGAPLMSFAEFVLVLVFNLIFGFLGEVILGTFLLSGIMRDIRAESQMVVIPQRVEIAPLIHSEARALAAPISPVTDREITVEIFGHEFLECEIVALSADAHYVSVQLVGNRRKLIRGKISEAVERLPSDLGLSIHRSHWVASRGVVGVVQEGRNSFVELTNGTRLAIARNRVQETRDWVERMGLEIKKAP